MPLLERLVHGRDAALVAIERLQRCALGDAGGVGRGLTLNGVHGGDQFLGAAAVAQTPAGHGIGLGHTVNGDGAIVQFGHHGQQAGERFRAPVDLLVHVIGADDDARMLEQHFAQRTPLGGGIGRASRIARAVDEQETGFVGDRGCQLLRRDLVALFWAGIRGHRQAVGQHYHVGVRHPIRGWDDHFVAGVQQCHAQVIDGLLGAGGHQDLVAFVLDVVVALELANDRVLEFHDAVDVGVTRVALADRVDACLGNVGRGVKVRLTGAQANDVFAFRLQLVGQCGDGQGGGRLDALRAPGHGDGHDSSIQR